MKTWRCPHGYVRQKDGTLQCEDCKEITKLRDEVKSLKARLNTSDDLLRKEQEDHQATKAKVVRALAGLGHISALDDWGSFGGIATTTMNEMDGIK